MRISHTALDACLRNPRQWYTSTRILDSHPYKMGYERALRLSTYHYHRTSAGKARAYLTELIKKHDFKNAKKVGDLEDDLESYILWANSDKVKSAGVQVRISLPLGFLELRGEVSRVDVTPSGYRAVLLGNSPPKWRGQLRMPLIQSAVSLIYGRPEVEIEVGFQKPDGTNLETVSFDQSQLTAARKGFRKLGAVIRRISRSSI